MTEPKNAAAPHPADERTEQVDMVIPGNVACPCALHGVYVSVHGVCAGGAGPPCKYFAGLYRHERVVPRLNRSAPLPFIRQFSVHCTYGRAIEMIELKDDAQGSASAAGAGRAGAAD